MSAQYITLSGRVLAIHSEEPIAIVEVTVSPSRHECWAVKNNGYLIGESIIFGVDDVYEDLRNCERAGVIGA